MTCTTIGGSSLVKGPGESPNSLSLTLVEPATGKNSSYKLVRQYLCWYVHPWPIAFVVVCFRWLVLTHTHHVAGTPCEFVKKAIFPTKSSTSEVIHQAIEATSAHETRTTPVESFSSTSLRVPSWLPGTAPHPPGAVPSSAW